MTRTVAIVGSAGFVGVNLLLRLSEQAEWSALPITRETLAEDAAAAIARADAVINLAGVNRPPDPSHFLPGTLAPIDLIAAGLARSGRAVPIIHFSSSRAGDGSDYGTAKLAGEQAISAVADAGGHPLVMLRLPNIFGKWARPNYNSAVATFCHNIARDLPIMVNDPAAPLTLTYIDDVVDHVVALLSHGVGGARIGALPCAYQTTVGEVVDIISGFRSDRSSNMIAAVGTGLTRALYATYVAALPVDQFSYAITAHRDPRGSFSEMLKTRDHGQFSTFTAHPGVTRGGHYHHSKVEKFLIVHGQARFRFRHVLSGEMHEVVTDADSPTVVETIPGWTHDVTNIGDDIMVSLLWANELFDPERPDTIAKVVVPS